MELREGAVVAERFRLVRQLGRGGMGEVWSAQHASLDVPCAVKFILGESADNPEVRERFEREAKAAAQLRSPNVVQILDYGVFEGTPYIAMEYLEGEPLNARLERHGRLSPHETARIVSQVARALTRAHAAGIVHRDLKPENVFLVTDDDTETAKVLDFGVAKQTAGLDSNTRTGALLGTPFYMSPEQAQGIKAVDWRADLWSLAVLAYRCLTGELPFKSEALGDLLIKIVMHPSPVPSHVAPYLPAELDAWWQRASQRDPAYRYQSAKELAQNLALALGTTMPSGLGATPMPHHMSVPPELAHAAQGHVPQTTAAGSWGGGPPTPFQGSPPGYPAAPAGPQQGYPSYGQGAAYPPAHESYPQLAPAAGGASEGGASVAGVFAPTPVAAPAANSSRAVLLGATVALLLGAGGAGTFFALRAAPAASEAGAAAADERAEPAPSQPAPAGEPTSSGEPAPTAEPASSGEPAASGEPASSGEPVASASVAVAPPVVVRPPGGAAVVTAPPPREPATPPPSRPPSPPTSGRPDLGF